MTVQARKGRAYERIRKLVKNFEDAAAGKPFGRAVDKALEYLDARIHRELARHQRTGNALRVADVQGSAERIKMRLAAYVISGNFKPGSTSAPAKAGHFIKWSFFRGTPASALARVKRIFTEEIRAALTA